ncbi:l- type ii [Fusarium austroafricanum]|uniref:asparaginase n=1 Tax=Fusarium austroafricanum TaxID=2364996 RepID=A0A8H4JY09_9HYPO|nr:l- type ii [Fusarium austroafricanum]
MRLAFTLVIFLFVEVTFNVLSKIILLHLGGTISGAAESPTNTTHYEAGAISIEDVIQGIRENLAEYANVIPKQFMSIDSVDMRLSDKLAITQRIKEELEAPDVAGLVVTTGTSGLAEFLVHVALTVKSNKPVVVTAAFKPHTAFGADGPQNIIDAVILASTPRWSEENQEIAMVMGGKISLPWGIRKGNGYFESRSGSLIGNVKRGKVSIKDLSDCYTTEKIDISGHSPNDSLPEVSLLTVYSGFDGRLVRLAADEGARAFVVTAYDGGYIPKEAANTIKKVIEEYDTPVVVAGYSSLIPVEYARVKGMIPGLDLDQRQVRQLLTVNQKRIGEYGLQNEDK